MDDFAVLLESTLTSWRAGGEPERIVAAVSGGADSVALLLTLNGIRKAAGFSLTVVHVNHGLREDAGEDAAFVADLCRRLNVPCRVMPVRVVLPGEDGARQARYQALLDACVQENADALTLAHHQRDQAETVLLHLFRGSGGEGLAGMAEYARRECRGRSVLLWRPFLDASPDDLRRILHGLGETWREDLTNARDDYLRNYLRHQVLPKVRGRIPEAEAALCRTAQLLAAEEDYFRAEARRFLTDHACLTGPCRWIDGPALDALHPALRRHCVRLSAPVKLNYAQTEALINLSPRQTANLPEGWRGLRTERYLHFLSPTPEKSRLGKLLVLPFTGDPGDGITCQAVPKALFEQCELRHRLPGDRIHPLGGPGDKSLQDYWVDRRVDRPFRDHMPLLCRGNRVIWSIGVGVGEEARVTPDGEAVFLRYDGFLPGGRPRVPSHP